MAFSLFAFFTFLTVSAQRPIVWTKYTADPAPYVHGDTVYLYTTHDEDDAEGFKMFDWLLYTSTDMVNWTDHGAVASLADFKWYRNNNGAWAEQVIERSGKWYMYCPIHGNGISVLVADSPYGPFKDPLGKPLVWQREHWYDIDPTVWIDDDNQAYLYWGNPNLYSIKLNPDMISTSGSIVQHPKIQDYQEGPWLYKRDGRYYMAFASTCCPEGIGYAMSDKITGPWQYKGDVMPHTQLSRGNHPGIISYKGKDYVFGLNYDLWAARLKYVGTPYRHAERRSVSCQELNYRSDGTIEPVPYWSKDGVEQVGTFNPYQRVQAETMAYAWGLKTRKDNQGNILLTHIHNNDCLMLKGVLFQKASAGTFIADVKNVQTPATIELRLDSPEGQLIGTVKIQNDGTAKATLKPVAGKHDLWFRFCADSKSASSLFEFDWWQIQK
ncbi:MAG: family 43 glycosylhydrolase [Bacteroidaceae bacterium]|nr:family 43 glycosylhydrolase [Bacteroidaceae bacterium]